MGIAGLFGFFKENSFYLQKVKLHNSKLIIDGNNLLYHLFSTEDPNFYLGGQYLKYYNTCRNFFEQLAICQIESFVIFDGSFEKDGNKFNISLERKLNNIKNSDAIAKGIPCSSLVAPLFAHEVFIQVLTDLRITKLTCLTEADQNIASLANEMNCPVLTNDSDFFIYDIPAGFIPFEYFNLNIQKEHNYSYLNVRKYQYDSFTIATKIKGNDLPILAVLMSNDIIEYPIRCTIMRGINLQNIKNKSEKYQGLLKWLAENETSDISIDKILSFFDHKNRDNVREKIQQTIKAYRQLPKTNAKSHITEKHTFDSCNCVEIFKNEVSYLTTSLAWLFVNTEASSLILEIMVNFRSVNQVQIERIEDVATSECSKQLRLILYGHIVSSMTNKTQAFLELKRVGDKFNEDILKPAIKNMAGSNIPSLSEIDFLDVSKKQHFLVECLVGHVIDNCHLSNSFLFYASVVCYWYNHTTKDVYLLQALIFFLFTQSKQINENIDVDAVVSLRANDDSVSQLNRDNYNKWVKLANNCPKDASLKTQFVYKYCQFQSCLKAAYHINTILLKPFHFQICFDGSLLFDIYQYLTISKVTGLDIILGDFVNVREQVLQALQFIEMHSSTANVNLNN